MTAARWEIVRTDAPQPWHARLRASNGKVQWSTENYARKAAADRAVVAAIRAAHPRLRIWVSNGTGGLQVRVGFPTDYYSDAQPVAIRYVDERAAS